MSAWQACPACGKQPEIQAMLPWGDGHQQLPVAPWMCASCGALALMELATGEIKPTTDAMWAVVRERNPVLWAAITRVRAQVKAEKER
jgi:hypothetical protein